MAEEIKLKPCPNCGEERCLVVDTLKPGPMVTAFAVRCSYCGTTGPYVYVASNSDISKRAAGETWNSLPRRGNEELDDPVAEHKKVVEQIRTAISVAREEAIPKEGEEDVAPMDAILQAALYEATEGEAAETVTEAVETALNGYIEELEMAVAVVRQMKEKNND